MEIRGVNADICTKCLECVAECPAHLFGQPEWDGSVVFHDPTDRCIACGHCVAVCPVNAVVYDAAEPALELGREPDSRGGPPGCVGYDAMIHAFRARRSVRRFIDRAVSRDDVAALLEAGRYAPSASNAQRRRYIVIRDDDTRRILVREVGKMMKTVSTLLKLSRILKPFVGGHMKRQLSSESARVAVAEMLQRIQAGGDPVFFGAPCIIVLHAPSYGHMPGNDAGLALGQIMSAAAARGLGTCWIGFAEEMLFRRPKIRRSLGIPRGNRAWGVLALGHPRVKYHRSPPREPLKIAWID